MLIKRNTTSKGFVLVSVLVIMSVLLVIAYYLADVLYSEYSIARNQRSASIALNLAEAGTQEAIWRIQNDSSARDTFLNSLDGQTIIPAKNLTTGGSYTVTIQNIAKATATITSTGYDKLGTKTAQRKITLNVTQSNKPTTYPYEAALLVGGPSSGNIYLHNMTLNYDDGYDPASIASAGNINIGNATIHVSQDILANKSIAVQNSTVDQGGTQQQNYSTPFEMPGIDFNSDSPSSYKSLAIAQGHYYTSDQFNNLLEVQTTFNGIFYVAGAGGVTIKNKSITFNGALISEGSVNVTNANLNIFHNPAPSGLLTLSNFNVTNANIHIEGLLYVGVLSAASNNANITIIGAVLAHDFSGNNCNITLNFKKDWVNETLSGGGVQGTPVIKFQHWEEEY
ncbi:TPA: hypothetical protein DD449_03135 [Candidatus Berkelbacteria bacterium]|uniref:Type 4 fimbrial biogenesis protein PilX N-terminal domain-containing protein n=1 Tax=Berkelbacteria bacterium GW2011_GWE1_39_12 TaxID=1618337 RepID=A0A0G4B4Z5_9BACT|nr:MAG: hypothetical protein UT28_C0001G0256 [Berkelbacteria bacterium GW2011_GWE1_39_12]HBO60652.1 hypothetical protein [Candidatus Berkelbacteria bacterium]